VKREAKMNVMDNGRVCAIIDRLQERLNQDPGMFEFLLDDIEELV